MGLAALMGSLDDSNNDIVLKTTSTLADERAKAPDMRRGKSALFVETKAVAQSRPMGLFGLLEARDEKSLWVRLHAYVFCVFCVTLTRASTGPVP